MPGTGNHKGCPYDGFVGAYFHRNDRVWLRCVRNDHGLMKATYGDENGLVPGTGNHKGCPYDGFVGAYFHSNDRVWLRCVRNDHGLAKAT